MSDRASWTPRGDGYDVATAYDGDTEFDRIGAWQTAISMANDGYRIVVHTGDAHLTKEELQAAVDHAHARHNPPRVPSTRRESGPA